MRGECEPDLGSFIVLVLCRVGYIVAHFFGMRRNRPKTLWTQNSQGVGGSVIIGRDRFFRRVQRKAYFRRAAMVILDILAIATRSYVEYYGTLTCYLVFLC